MRTTAIVDDSPYEKALETLDSDIEKTGTRYTRLQRPTALSPGLTKSTL